MSGSVTIERRDGIALLTLNNPPVNGLRFAMRAALGDRVMEALADEGVTAIVVAGAGRMFCGGADIREFGEPPPPGAASLPAVLGELEASRKPVVAAIHGVAAGGGLELALACHVRVVAAGARLGLPEVTLGIVPGAGGTQRLPRLIGVEAALDLIVGGKLLPTEQAVALGIADELVEGNLLEAAIARARQLATDGAALRRASALDERVAEARAHPEIFDAFRKKMARRARGFDAPYACVECVEAAVTLPFAAGMDRERQIFERLVASDQSAAQRHAFFAEREATKIPDVPGETQSLPIARAAVIGCGTMGGGIAMTFANAGIPVTVVDNLAGGAGQGACGRRAELRGHGFQGPARPGGDGRTTGPHRRQHGLRGRARRRHRRRGRIRTDGPQAGDFPPARRRVQAGRRACHQHIHA